LPAFPVPPLQRGNTVDRYVIEQLLGVGGMGEVYQARGGGPRPSERRRDLRRRPHRRARLAAIQRL
jgi:hypothetical protein